MSQAANLAEKAVGHTGDATTEQNMTNPARDTEKYADPSGATMKALTWNGKNSVKLGPYTAYSIIAEGMLKLLQLTRRSQKSLSPPMSSSRSLVALSAVLTYICCTVNSSPSPSINASADLYRRNR